MKLNTVIITSLFIFLLTPACNDGDNVDCDQELRHNYSHFSNIEIIEGTPAEARFLVTNNDSNIFPIYNHSELNFIRVESNGVVDTIKFILDSSIHATEIMNPPPQSASYKCGPYVTSESFTSSFQCSKNNCKKIVVKLLGGVKDGRLELIVDSTNFGIHTWFYMNTSLSGNWLSEFKLGGKVYYNVYRCIGNNQLTGRIEPDTLYYHHKEGIIKLALKNKIQFLKY